MACIIFFLISEIRNGLIGVGLINVEDRSGVLSLDKGERFSVNFILVFLSHNVQGARWSLMS